MATEGVQEGSQTASLKNLRVFYMGLCGVEKVDGKKGIGLR